jgi:hypothetical protein
MAEDSRVFLSYSRKDRQRATRLQTALTRRGMRVRRDERSIPDESW